MKRYRIPIPLVRHGTHQRLKPPAVRIECSPLLDWKSLRPMVRFAVVYAIKEAGRTRSMRYATKEIALRFERTRRRCWRGWAYNRHANLYIGELYTKSFLNKYARYQGMPEFWVRDWIEYLVVLVAHEMWHVVGHPGSGKEAEIECELIASDCLDAWRRHRGYTFTPPPQPQPEYETKEPLDLVLA